MPNIDLSVNTGQTKQLTFNCANTYMPEDIVFNITASGGDADTSYVIYCETAAGTQTKTGTSVTSFTPTTGGTYYVRILNANSYNGAIKFKGNGVPSTAQTIYINGTISSALNRTLPAGLYEAYYDGATWWFRTDGKRQGGGFSVPGSSSGLLKNDGGSISLSNNTSQFLRGDGQWATPSGGGSDNTFKVTFTVNNSTISCDHTIAEIYTAYTGGKLILGSLGYTGSMNFILHDCSSISAQFLQYETTGGVLIRGTRSGNTDSWVSFDKTNLYTVLFADDGTGNNQYAATPTFDEIANAINRTEPIIVGRLVPSNPNEQNVNIRDYVLTFHDFNSNSSTHYIKFTSYEDCTIYEMIGEATYSNGSYSNESWVEVEAAISGGGGGGTHYVGKNVFTNTSSGTSNTAVNNGTIYLNHVENNSVTTNGSLSIAAGTGITVQSNGSGQLTISSTGGGTHYVGKNVFTNSSSGTSNATVSSGSVYLNHVENNSVTTNGSLSIVGSGNTTVTCNGGVLTISSTGGGGGSTVSLPSGYSAANGITLGGSNTTVATVNGTNLNLKVGDMYSFGGAIQNNNGVVYVDSLLFEDGSGGARYLPPELGATHLPVVFQEAPIPICYDFVTGGANIGDDVGYMEGINEASVGGTWLPENGYTILNGDDNPNYALTVCLPKILDGFMSFFATFCNENFDGNIYEAFSTFFDIIVDAGRNNGMLNQ